MKWVVMMTAVLYLGLLISPDLSLATSTINVPSVGNSTIQSAISHAVNGDTVLVSAGTYRGQIDFGGKAVTVRSAGGALVTTINGNASGSVVIFASLESNSSVLSGFTITNGSSSYGGGIYCSGSSPTITNCTIHSNRATLYDGGGIFCDSSSPIISNCTISGNSGGVYGGGIWCSNSSSPTISNCTIRGNSVTDAGGGIWCGNSSSPTISNCTISNNTASGTSTGWGGGIWCGNSSTPVISNCTIRSNSAGVDGGGIECYYSSAAISNCTLSGNTAIWGGGVECDTASPTITNCTISSNTANYDGGGISCHDSSPAITNCTLSSNTAQINGGGILCTASSSPTVRNSILWGDIGGGSPNEIYLFSSSITITYSDIQGGWLMGTGNINSDPKFTGAGDYHLQHGSPCIDAANSNSPVTSHDKDGNPRYDDPNTPNTGSGTNGSYYDMGAYERQTPSNTNPSVTIDSPNGGKYGTGRIISYGRPPMPSRRQSVHYLPPCITATWLPAPGRRLPPA